MRLLIKISTLLLSITSCAVSNNATVPITVSSDPIGAKIYIDDIYHGNTATGIDLILDQKKHTLRLVKYGYETVNIDMEIGFIQRLYDIELSPIAVVKEPQDVPAPQTYIPFSTHNYYLSPDVKTDELGENQNSSPILNDAQIDQSINSSPQILFNSQSEFVNNGNEAKFNRSFNRKSKINYYNWQ